MSHSNRMPRLRRHTLNLSRRGPHRARRPSRSRLRSGRRSGRGSCFRGCRRRLRCRRRRLRSWRLLRLPSAADLRRTTSSNNNNTSRSSLTNPSLGTGTARTDNSRLPFRRPLRLSTSTLRPRRPLRARSRLVARLPATDRERSRAAMATCRLRTCSSSTAQSLLLRYRLRLNRL